jgi:cobalt-zinc-cadmium efflux system membrane fusion protein
VQRDAQTFEARDVTLGEGNGEMIKILDGLQEGEPVVVKGAYVLKSELLSDQI